MVLAYSITDSINELYIVSNDFLSSKNVSFSHYVFSLGFFFDIIYIMMPEQSTEFCFGSSDI